MKKKDSGHTKAKLFVVMLFAIFGVILFMSLQDIKPEQKILTIKVKGHL